MAAYGEPMGGEPDTDRIEQETGWHLFKIVTGDGRWYARRPQSSPPKVIGPLPLAEVLAELAERVAQQDRWDATH